MLEGELYICGREVCSFFPMWTKVCEGVDLVVVQAVMRHLTVVAFDCGALGLDLLFLAMNGKRRMICGSSV